MAEAHGATANEAPTPDRCGAEGETEGRGEEDLAEREEALTREVPTLLETMNRASSEVNTLESQVSEAQARYKKLLEQWSRLYEDVRAQHGSSVDRAKPYFEAAQVLEASSLRVQSAVREFSAASTQHSQSKRELHELEERLAYGAHKISLDGDQQDGLSRATVRVLRCQQERDRREQEYARALRDFEEAQEALDSWRAQIGDATIKRALPCFRQLQQHQHTLAAEQTRINALAERARAAKSAYTHSLRELDRINMAVHEARRSHGSSCSRPPAASGELGRRDSAAKAEGPARAPPEETPEATPEEATPFATDMGFETLSVDLATKLVLASSDDDGPFA